MLYLSSLAWWSPRALSVPQYEWWGLPSWQGELPVPSLTEGWSCARHTLHGQGIVGIFQASLSCQENKRSGCKQFTPTVSNNLFDKALPF